MQVVTRKLWLTRTSDVRRGGNWGKLSDSGNLSCNSKQRPSSKIFSVWSRFSVFLTNWLYSCFDIVWGNPKPILTGTDGASRLHKKCRFVCVVDSVVSTCRTWKYRYHRGNVSRRLHVVRRKLRRLLWPVRLHQHRQWKCVRRDWSCTLSWDTTAGFPSIALSSRKMRENYCPRNPAANTMDYWIVPLLTFVIKFDKQVC